MIDGRMIVVDCQSDLLSAFRTRFVVPLLPPEHLPTAHRKLNPAFQIAGERLLLAPQGSTSVFARELGTVIGSVWDDQHRVTAAIDMLLSGV